MFDVGSVIILCMHMASEVCEIQEALCFLEDAYIRTYVCVTAPHCIIASQLRIPGSECRCRSGCVKVQVTVCLYWRCRSLCVCTGGAGHCVSVLEVQFTVCLYWRCRSLCVCTGGVGHCVSVLEVQVTVCLYWRCRSLCVCTGGAGHCVSVLEV